MDDIVYDHKFKARYPPKFFAERKPKQQCSCTRQTTFYMFSCDIVAGHCSLYTEKL